MQNLIATQLGVQMITGITVFNTREEQTYDPFHQCPFLDSKRGLECYWPSNLYVLPSNRNHGGDKEVYVLELSGNVKYIIVHRRFLMEKIIWYVSIFIFSQETNVT
ncbi:unnamed protein product [Prunus brigantina]